MITVSLKKQESLFKKYQALVFENIKTKLFEFLLRIGVSLTFLGHGILALGINEKWISLITAFGFGNEAARNLLPIIGSMDIFMALVLLFYPIRAIVIWAIIWPFAASVSYLVAGQTVWEFVERTSNWILPLALLLVMGVPKKKKVFEVR